MADPSGKRTPRRLRGIDEDHRVGAQRPPARTFVATEQKDRLEVVVGGVAGDGRDRIGAARCDEHLVDDFVQLIGPNHRIAGRKGHDEQAHHRYECGEPLTRAGPSRVDHFDHCHESGEHEHRADHLDHAQDRGVQDEARDPVAPDHTHHRGGERHENPEQQEQRRQELATHERRCARYDERSDDRSRRTALFALDPRRWRGHRTVGHRPRANSLGVGRRRRKIRTSGGSSHGGNPRWW